MRFVTYAVADGESVGVRTGVDVRPTGFTSMVDLIRAGKTGLATAADRASRERAVADVRLLAPLTTPGQILCCAVNYPGHQYENQAAGMRTRPFFFSKLPSAVIGPGAPIVIPRPRTRADYEVELAVVIGRSAKRVSAAAALGYVFGYTVLNDVSARDIQLDDDQLTIGKGVDTFCPLGPEIVTSDELVDPDRLSIQLWVNDDLRQSASTSEQLRTVAELLEVVTQYVTLSPGDIVTTGTPSGVGFHRTPPTYLAPGDVVHAKIETIGSLINPVTAGW